MELLRDLGALGAWLGAVETCVLLAVACLPNLALLPRPALRLAALPALGLLAEAVLAWPLPPTPRPATLEALSWHPVVGPLGCGLALPGLVALVCRGLAVPRAGRVRTGRTLGCEDVLPTSQARHRARLRLATSRTPPERQRALARRALRFAARWLPLAWLPCCWLQPWCWACLGG